MAKWVFWSSGELRIDSASFALVVVPEGEGKRSAAKPLGVLTGASIIGSMEPGALSTFVATTNDPVHGVLRLNFQSLTDEEAFVAIASSAEASAHGGARGARRSSVGACRRSSVGAGAAELPEGLLAQLRERHPGLWPAVHGLAWARALCLCLCLSVSLSF